MKVSWTHIVVGCGAAGCVVAARLSEKPEHRVLLVEEGIQSRDPRIRVPMTTGLLLRGSRHTRLFQTEPVPGLNNRQTQLPRGIVLDGSIAINGMIYIRGLAQDYDTWSAQGLAGWSYEQLLPWFKKSEKFLGPAGVKDFHGASGSLGVSRRDESVCPITDRYIDAGSAAGYAGCEDCNVPAPEGFGLFHFTIQGGRRVTAVDAFLNTARKRENLEVMCGNQVERINFTQGRATSVAVTTRSGPAHLHCEQEVILSAGVSGTPAILMRSGIGPADDLNRLSVPVTVDSSETGSNLQDHVLVRVRHKVKPLSCGQQKTWITI